jgi:hypothetical protein
MSHGIFAGEFFFAMYVIAQIVLIVKNGTK